MNAQVFAGGGAELDAAAAAARLGRLRLEGDFFEDRGEGVRSGGARARATEPGEPKIHGGTREDRRVGGQPGPVCASKNDDIGRMAAQGKA